MNTVIMWVGLALLVALLTFLNQKQVYSSKVKTSLPGAKKACREGPLRAVGGGRSGRLGSFHR
ncbi:hypothetical protein ACFTAO_35570 [Paenibacillus rhizoplanae]